MRFQKWFMEDCKSHLCTSKHTGKRMWMHVCLIIALQICYAFYLHSMTSVLVESLSLHSMMYSPASSATTSYMFSLWMLPFITTLYLSLSLTSRSLWYHFTDRSECENSHSKVAVPLIITLDSSGRSLTNLIVFSAYLRIVIAWANNTGNARF